MGAEETLPQTAVAEDSLNEGGPAIYLSDPRPGHWQYPVSRPNDGTGKHLSKYFSKNPKYQTNRFS